MVQVWTIVFSLLLFSPAHLFADSESNVAPEAEVAVEQKIPFSMKDKADLPNTGRIVFSAIVGIALVFLVIFLLKKFFYQPLSFKEEKSLIDIVKSKRITTKLTAHVINVGDKSYLIVEKGEAISVLHHGIIEEKDS